MARRCFSGRSGDLDVSLSRARKVWHATSRSPNATLVAAWVVEVYASNSPTTSTLGDAFRMVIAADDGRVLDERNLVADAAFNYRVFAETTGEMHPFDGPIVDSTPHPTGIAERLVPGVRDVRARVGQRPQPSERAGAADPWLADRRTETIGNNVEAYADFNAPDGLTFGDFRATTTAAGDVRSRLRPRGRAACRARASRWPASRRCSTSSTGCTTSGTTAASPRRPATRRTRTTAAAAKIATRSSPRPKTTRSAARATTRTCRRPTTACRRACRCSCGAARRRAR